MRIAVLGWGSLYWDRRELRARDGWHTNGPVLPIEFARVSRDRRLTLVLFEQAEGVQVLWAEMDVTTVNEAIVNLSQREETNENNIGCVDLHNPTNNKCRVTRVLDVIREWAQDNNLDTVIWTDLPPNFHEKTGRDFNESNVITYLSSDLDDDSRKKAEEYVRGAPPQIRTRMRCKIEESLGWAHSGNNFPSPRNSTT